MRILHLSKRIVQIVFLVTVLMLIGSILPAQTLTQTVRGTVVDKQVKSPLMGVIVQVLNSSPAKGTTTDMNGNFKLEGVAVGRQSLKISLLGYKEIVLNDVAVTSGKELVLSIELEESVVETKEVVITADKKQPLNGMSTVSARTVSVEETQRYAAAVNDPARAALAYAGVASVGDGNNYISIRGNAPNGLLWRMEGVEVPNPNHFSTPGAAGGGISILSAQLLSNSDFITGAFASEYGNASSGVFDLRLRRGNNERREFTFQAGVLGMDAAMEGPFSSKHRGSYLVNYRYSTLGLLGKAGILGDGGVTTFQDLSYNIVLPTEKYGQFTFFGFGGLSSEVYSAEKDSAIWQGDYDRYSSKFFSNTGASGMTWSKPFNDHLFLKLAAVASSTSIGFRETYLLNDYTPREQYYNSYSNNKLTLSAVVTNKFNAHHLLRSGLIMSQQGYKVAARYYDEEENVSKEFMKADGTTQVVQAFTQWQFRPTEKLTLNAGFHSLYLALNDKVSVEPRAAVRWEFREGQSLSAGYGMHSQVLPLSLYFTKTTLPDGTSAYTNTDLDLLKAHHFVVAYDRSIAANMRVKVETYYQMLFNVPVGADPRSTYAFTNEIWDGVRDSLVSEGEGRNAGVELTLEKFFSKGSYFLLSGSLFNSNYKTLENTWRNTRFNGKYLITFTGGKEWTLSEKRKGRVIGFNVKVIYAGGYYDSPIDMTESAIAGHTVYDEANAFSDKMPDYFRTDIRLSLKRNYTKWTSTVSIDIQNLSNRKNIFNKYYNAEKNALEYNYQSPLIPVLSYRIEF
jgi:hypothetical protein